MEDLSYELARDDYYITITECVEKGFSVEKIYKIVSVMPYAKSIPKEEILKDIKEYLDEFKKLC